MKLELPIQTVSEANRRGHWAAKNKRAQQQRKLVYMAACTYLRDKEVPCPCVVRLTRLASRTLDDDNLRGAFKAVRDGLADFLGIDDGKVELVRYEYAQEKTRRDSCGIRIEFEPMPDVARIDTQHPAMASSLP